MPKFNQDLITSKLRQKLVREVWIIALNLYLIMK